MAARILILAIATIFGLVIYLVVHSITDVELECEGAVVAVSSGFDYEIKCSGDDPIYGFDVQLVPPGAPAEGVRFSEADRIASFENPKTDEIGEIEQITCSYLPRNSKRQSALECVIDPPVRLEDRGIRGRLGIDADPCDASLRFQVFGAGSEESLEVENFDVAPEGCSSA